MHLPVESRIVAFASFVILLLFVSGRGGAALASTPLLSRQDEARNFVVQMYQRYYRRTPNNSEIEVWLAGIRRGDKLDDVHASFIGSDEFFAICNRNYPDWIEGMFLATTNRQPNPGERNYWTSRLTAARNDRRTVAREFLKTIGHANPLPPGNSGTAENLPAQLVTNAQFLVQGIGDETSGIGGNLLRIQANNLLSSAQVGQQAFANASRDPQRARMAYDNLDAAIQGLDASLRNQTNANTSRYYLSQVFRIHRAIGDRLPLTAGQPSGPVYPPMYPPASSRSLDLQEAKRINLANDNVTRQFQQLYFLLQNISQQDYRYRALLGDVGTVGGRFQSLGVQIRAGYPVARLLTELQSLDRSIKGLSERIGVGMVDLRVSQTWYECVNAFGLLSGEASQLQDSAIPVLPGTNWNLQTTLAWIDQSVDQCDVLINQYSHFYLNGSTYTRFLTQLRNLKNSLVVLRLHLTQSAGSATLRADWQTGRDNYEMTRSMNPVTNPFSRSTGPTSFTALENSMAQLAVQMGNQDE
jgi:hypothetical protein